MARGGAVLPPLPLPFAPRKEPLLGVLSPAVDAGFPDVAVNVRYPLLFVVRDLAARRVGVMCTDRLHPLRELLGGVADACPHGGRLRGLGILPCVGDIVDGAIELAFILNDVARLAPPVLIPDNEQVRVLSDRHLVELLILRHLDEHDLSDGLGV